MKDFRLDFMPGGQEYVEPAAADVIESEGGEVHGMAILLDKEIAILKMTSAQYWANWTPSPHNLSEL